jgi:hypothetical protein
MLISIFSPGFKFHYQIARFYNFVDLYFAEVSTNFSDISSYFSFKDPPVAHL